MKRDLQIYRNEADRPHAPEAMVAWLWTILFVVIVGSTFVQSQFIPKVIETATAAAATLP